MSEPHTILAVSMAKELKPCPFCGSEGEHLFHDVPLTKWKHRIVCVSTTCGMDGPVEATRFDAISAWNRRSFQASKEVSLMSEWKEVPGEPTLEFLKSTNIDNQVLAYENGRYYNAWFEFDEFEGGWFWTDEAGSEPNPSHYMPLPKPPITTPDSSLTPP